MATAASNQLSRSICEGLNCDGGGREPPEPPTPRQKYCVLRVVALLKAIIPYEYIIPTSSFVHASMSAVGTGGAEEEKGRKREEIRNAATSILATLTPPATPYR